MSDKRVDFGSHYGKSVLVVFIINYSIDIQVLFSLFKNDYIDCWKFNYLRKVFKFSFPYFSATSNLT